MRRCPRWPDYGWRLDEPSIVALCRHRVVIVSVSRARRQVAVRHDVVGPRVAVEGLRARARVGETRTPQHALDVLLRLGVGRHPAMGINGALPRVVRRERQHDAALIAPQAIAEVPDAAAGRSGPPRPGPTRSSA